MIKRILISSFSFLILCLLVPFAMMAQQNGTIKGRITTSDKKPAGYVSVALAGAKSGAITNEAGEYQINKVKPGSYILKVTAVGLQSQEKSVVVNAGETVTADFELTENLGQLKEVIISGARNKYKVDKPSSSLRLDQPLLEIPQNIQIITSTALADQQALTLSDGVLRNVSGATRLEHWGEIYTRVNMRGTRASAFRNGFNVTSDWGPVNEDMSFVDHIEFVKGPSGFLMSNGEPAGIYNVVTKKPTGRDFGGEASVTFGSYDLYRGSLDLDGKLVKSGKLLYRLNMMAQNKKSFRDYEFNDRYIVAPVLSYKLSNKTTVTAEYTYQHVKMSDLGSAYVFATDDYAILPRKFTISEPDLKPTKVNDHSAFLNFQHRFNDKWKLTAQGAYFFNKQLSSDIWPANVLPNGDIIRTLYNFDAILDYRFGQVFVNGDVQTGAVRHRILGGVDLGKKQGWFDWSQALALDSEQKPFNIYNPVYGSPANGIPSFNRSIDIKDRAVSITDQAYTGLYLQDELGFLENKVRLTLAGRYTFLKQESTAAGETTTLKDNKFTPRVGLSVSVDNQTSAYALYDQTFLPQDGKLESGKAPDPVTGNNIEFGLKRDWFDGKWSSNLSVYRILKKNQLSASPNSTPANPVSLQLGESRAQGIEFDVRGEIVKGLNVVANYALTDYEITKSVEEYGAEIPAGTKIAGYAKHNINTWLTYKLQSGVLKGSGVSAGFTYQTDRSSWTWASSGQKDLPSYFRLDGGLFWEKDKIKVTGNVFNILDKYLYSGAAYGSYYYWQAEAPRNFRLSVSYRF